MENSQKLTKEMRPLIEEFARQAASRQAHLMLGTEVGEWGMLSHEFQVTQDPTFPKKHTFDAWMETLDLVAYVTGTWWWGQDAPCKLTVHIHPQE